MIKDKDWSEKMQLRKQYIALILVAALVLGFIGAYVGVELAQRNEVKEDELVNDGVVATPKSMEKIDQAYALIKEHYVEDVEGNTLIEGAIQGMLDTLEDPYSTYMDVETMNRFQEQIESSFEGIGAEVSMVNGKVTIIAPIKDSPAENAGLRPNDQIITIDKDGLEGLDLNEAVEKIRGEKGSKVVLGIERPGASEIFEMTITRDEIPLETVYAELKTIKNKKTGIIELTSFSEETSKDFTTELIKLEESGMEGLIIDVRGNPGGLLNSVEEILQQFILKDTPYIQTEDQKGEKVPYYSELEEEKDYPINILIDEGSASASEILAVAMKEVGHDIIGTTSFGKGTVQQAIPLGDGSTIKLTFYKWLSPNGEWINEKGVEPTVEQKQPDYFYTHPIQIEEALTYNHTGDKIENMQRMLNGLDYKTDREDGYFDKTTVAAVKKFQTDNKLKATGEVDADTAELIESKIIDKIRDGKDDQQLEKAFDTLYK